MLEIMTQIEILKKNIQEAEAIIVGGASGMSAAAGFRFYYMNDATFKQIAGQLGEKYHADGFFPLFYHPQIKKGELWAALLREYKYLYECYTGEPYEDLAELLKGKNYYIATTNQDAQFFRTFPAEKITRIQGDFRYWQCKHTCTDEIYPNKEKVYELLDKIEGDRLPDDLIPRCPHCGTEMVPWWRSREFLEGSYYRKEMQRYMDFLKKNMNKKVLFLELGVGMMTPMFIKEPFMNMVYRWPNATYAVLNPKDAYVPKEIAKKSIAIKEDIAVTLKKLLGKPADHIVSDTNFEPGRIY